MAVLIPDGYAQVTYNWQHNESERVWSTVIGVAHESVGAVAVADTALGAWNNHLQEFQDNSLVLVSVSARMGPSGGPDPGPTVELPVGVAGGAGMNGAIYNSAMLVRKLSAFGGRSNRGRNYWPGFLSETQVDEVGRIDEAVVDGMQTAFTSWAGALGSGNSGGGALTPLVILHDESAPTTIPRLVVAISVERLIGTQRRRIRP